MQQKPNKHKFTPYTFKTGLTTFLLMYIAISAIDYILPFSVAPTQTTLFLLYSFGISLNIFSLVFGFSNRLLKKANSRMLFNFKNIVIVFLMVTIGLVLRDFSSSFTFSFSDLIYYPVLNIVGIFIVNYFMPHNTSSNKTPN